MTNRIISEPSRKKKKGKKKIPNKKSTCLFSKCDKIKDATGGSSVLARFFSVSSLGQSSGIKQSFGLLF